MHVAAQHHFMMGMYKKNRFAAPGTIPYRGKKGGKKQSYSCDELDSVVCITTAVVLTQPYVNLTMTDINEIEQACVEKYNAWSLSTENCGSDSLVAISCRLLPYTDAAVNNSTALNDDASIQQSCSGNAASGCGRLLLTAIGSASADSLFADDDTTHKTRRRTHVEPETSTGNHDEQLAQSHQTLTGSQRPSKPRAITLVSSRRQTNSNDENPWQKRNLQDRAATTTTAMTAVNQYCTCSTTASGGGMAVSYRAWTSQVVAAVGFLDLVSTTFTTLFQIQSASSSDDDNVQDQVNAALAPFGDIATIQNDVRITICQFLDC
uniref:Uncharacterized protein n=1 Tax=Entomoneis paludosa TaxID=265537 RepID=A0A7S2V9F3_9STRA